MAGIAPISGIDTFNTMHAFQDIRSMESDTEAQGTDAIQSKGEAQDDQNVKNNLREKGVGTNIDIFM